MASVQPNSEMPGQGPLAANITREQIQHVFQVRTRPVMFFCATGTSYA
jgi:hypothetical protein